MAMLVTAIHAFFKQVVDGRNKSGHDVEGFMHGDMMVMP
jgi:hypothetical protein